MYRPRLRTKTGCLTCRRRRKKCNEQKPACHDCSRYGLHCVWPESVCSSSHGSHSSHSGHNTHRGTHRALAAASAASTPMSGPPDASKLRWDDDELDDTESPGDVLAVSLDPSFRRSSTLSILCPSVLCHPLQSRTSREHDLFRHFLVTFWPLLLRSESHPGFHSVITVYTNVMVSPLMVDAYIGLAALHLSRGDQRLQAVAEAYYYKAVAAFSRCIEDGELDGTEDWLLTTTVYFYIFENWRSSASCDVMHHLEGAAQILRLRKLRGVTPPFAIGPMAVVERLVTESFIYHAATVSLFYRDVDRLSSLFSWSGLFEGLTCVPFPAATKDENSPVIALSPEIFRISFEVTRLSRRAPLDMYDKLEACHFKDELDKLKHVSSDWPIATIYNLLLEILLCKLVDNKTKSSDPHIQDLVQQALRILLTRHGSSFGVPSTTYLCWPAAILACAVVCEEDLHLVKEQLIKLWKDTFCGYIRRTALVIERVWKWRTGQLQVDECGDELGGGHATEAESVRDGLVLLTGPGLSRFLSL